MAEPLEAQRDAIAARIRSARILFAFTDFDGTLTPIVSDPMSCRVKPEVAESLCALSKRPGTYVGIVSGRELSDLRPRVNVDGITYAGNHGFEIEGPGFSFREPSADRSRVDLDQLLAEIATAIAGIPGAWVQHKGLTASIHFRQVESSLVPQVIDAVNRITQKDRDAGRFVLRTGKAVLEVRPSANWHKGRAIRWIADRIAPANTDAVLIYLGDDETDEDAFNVLEGQITVRVGSNGNTAAAYRVAGPDDVAEFFAWLVTLPAPQIAE